MDKDTQKSFLELRLLDQFNDAVDRFWCLAHQKEKKYKDNEMLHDAMKDTADEAFLARDGLAGSELNEKLWNGVIADVADMSEYLKRNEIHMNRVPQTTSTGRTTYRILNKPNRFD